MELGTPLHIALPRFLFQYRITPHVTTGESPCVLMFGRTIHSRLSLVKPNLGDTVNNKQSAQMVAQGGTFLRVLHKNERVMVKVHPHGQTKWTSGVVKEGLGSRLYSVLTDEGVLVHRHINQLRARGSLESAGMEVESTEREPVVESKTAEAPEEEETTGFWEPLSRGETPDMGTCRVETDKGRENRKYPLRRRKERVIFDL
ncbi:uncharacterized protein K02A2.6-like [Ischnura elegans]|uniref:uncharacterized protein K02A2.6-like n=1 Tax=Ischnura elegans TaxID=197161 RepID=UPI001ED8674F|nr:uncharacterized protein K02A2.6-like [Ischnura elegans]